VKPPDALSGARDATSNPGRHRGVALPQRRLDAPAPARINRDRFAYSGQIAIRVYSNGTEHGAADGRGLAEGRDPGRRPRTSPLVGGEGHGRRRSVPFDEEDLGDRVASEQKQR
jgi:hypothetical protein